MGKSVKSLVKKETFSRKLTLPYLSFPVDSNDAIGWLMLGGHEDSVRADPIFGEILAF